jgi:hypothetical protein
MFACRACQAKDETIAMLREQIAADRAERAELLNRIMALSNPQALAMVASGERAGTEARNDDGTVSILENGTERVLGEEEGDRIYIDGEWYDRAEVEQIMRRIEAEAAGVAPGVVNG